VTASFALPDSLATLRPDLSDPDMRRKAGAYGMAALVHAALVALVLTLPPAVMPQIERAVTAINVRLYTVAGGADAETDAPLFEPPLAGGESGDGDASAQRGAASQASPDAETPAPPDSAPVETPVETPQETPEADIAPAPDPDAGSNPASATLVQDLGDGPDTAPPPAGPAVSEGGAGAPLPIPPQSLSSVQAGAPIATTQPDPDAVRAPGRAGPPSFADILARAETRLDPEDFRMLVDLRGGVQATVRESFCLSSVDANREAMDCPEGPNPNSARLAEFGLMGLGEEPPEFLEDMDRLAFQLSTLGADDNVVTRILTALRESRREALNTAPIVRQMRRDEGRTDNLGNPVDGPPMPGDPGG
jgi:hypothetical protein